VLVTPTLIPASPAAPPTGYDKGYRSAVVPD